MQRDQYGFLLTGDDLVRDPGWTLERAPLSLETSVPGVLAAGDIRHGSVKRVAAAVGEGSIAAQLVHRLFSEEEAGGVRRDPGHPLGSIPWSRSRYGARRGRGAGGSRCPGASRRG